MNYGYTNARKNADAKGLSVNVFVHRKKMNLRIMLKFCRIVMEEYCYCKFTQKGMLNTRIDFDKTFWMRIVQKLADFYINFYQPALTAEVA